MFLACHLAFRRLDLSQSIFYSLQNKLTAFDLQSLWDLKVLVFLFVWVLFCFYLSGFGVFLNFFHLKFLAWHFMIWLSPFLCVWFLFVYLFYDKVLTYNVIYKKKKRKKAISIIKSNIAWVSFFSSAFIKKRWTWGPYHPVFYDSVIFLRILHEVYIWEIYKIFKMNIFFLARTSYKEEK